MAKRKHVGHVPSVRTVAEVNVESWSLVHSQMSLLIQLVTERVPKGQVRKDLLEHLSSASDIISKEYDSAIEVEIQLRS